MELFFHDNHLLLICPHRLGSGHSASRSFICSLIRENSCDKKSFFFTTKDDEWWNIVARASGVTILSRVTRHDVVASDNKLDIKPRYRSGTPCRGSPKDIVCFLKKYLWRGGVLLERDPLRFVFIIFLYWGATEYLGVLATHIGRVALYYPWTIQCNSSRVDVSTPVLPTLAAGMDCLISYVAPN